MLSVTRLNGFDCCLSAFTMCDADSLHWSQGIKLNEDALFIKIYDQEVPDASGAAKPEL